MPPAVALDMARGIATHCGQLPKGDKRPELISLPPIVTFTVIYGRYGDSRWRGRYLFVDTYRFCPLTESSNWADTKKKCVADTRGKKKVSNDHRTL